MGTPRALPDLRTAKVSRRSYDKVRHTDSDGKRSPLYTSAHAALTTARLTEFFGSVVDTDTRRKSGVVSAYAWDAPSMPAGLRARVTVTVEYDEDANWADYGYIPTNNPDKHEADGVLVLRNPRAWRRDGDEWVRTDHRVCGWIALENGWSWPERHDAERIVRKLVNEEFGFYGVRARVDVFASDETPIGHGESSVWGVMVESSSDPYLFDCAKDVAEEALGNAREAARAQLATFARIAGELAGKSV